MKPAPAKAGVINAAALDYMRERALAAYVIDQLAEHADRCFADQRAFNAHLEKLGITTLKINPDPVLIATEAALWGSVKAHGFLSNTVIPACAGTSDDAGQFNVGRHALCWIHAERLVHKLDTFTDEHRLAQDRSRAAIWTLYGDLKSYRQQPSPPRKTALAAEFDRIFTLNNTGFVTLDRLLGRLHANKTELLMVLERPEIPLHTNATENDIRCQSLPPRRRGSPDAKSAAEPAAIPAVTVATPSSASPKPAPNSASPSATTSAQGSISQGAQRFHTSPNSSPPSAARPDRHGFCPSYGAPNISA